MNGIPDFDYLRDLTIGTVEFVSPSTIRVKLEFNTPVNTAFNAGFPVSFPKINGFVLVPNEVGAIVGMISWIGVENSLYPKRTGLKDFDLIDLPFPQRKMQVNLLGTLKTKRDGTFEFERGVYQFPSVGDAVSIPTNEEMQAIVENRERNANVIIGTAPIAGNVPVKINPDTLFGRHVAVLGNTGSGKSCSVAGLVRWSIETAKINNKKSGALNARFIVFDPNGEYSKTFDTLGEPRKFRVNIGEDLIHESTQLQVPAWMWNSYEWSSIAQASGKMQRPILRRALRELRNGGTISNDIFKARIDLTSYHLALKTHVARGYDILSDKNERTAFGKRLVMFKGDFEHMITLYDHLSEVVAGLGKILRMIEDIINKYSKSFVRDEETIQYFESISRADFDNLVANMQEVLDSWGGEVEYEGPNEDTPVEFDLDQLTAQIAQISKEQNAIQYVDYLIMRIQTMIADIKMSSIINNKSEMTLSEWLETYIGDGQGSGAVVIDLSLVPSEIIHLIVAVMSRIIFESLQRYRRKNGKPLPTVMVLEEAHHFLSRYVQNSEELSPASMCTQTFERIAREGRKFGLGLMISSQRPSELSPTVLSQCNTFLLHRIVNDRDQELVKRLVPDNLGEMLSELPVLPTGKALLIGAASSIPILVEMKQLKEEERPHSSDPDFWDVWTRKVEREVDWKAIAREWQVE
ncbi:ATP-binding protein [Paenibacillus sp. VCA1]|uniref:ATP-binding protein n=1 Tax=Paenibacillus sp. VCA1 TaxID=3039148 RepID=UPI00287283E2|nr:ATP-binding protein [Paenibacillus sp. VCA1]MDR9857313.1 ATP-binding protein [Paenibacillus sp. VCA1]